MPQYADNISVYIGNPKKPIKKMCSINNNDFSKFAWHKINWHKSNVFLLFSNDHVDTKIE